MAASQHWPKLVRDDTWNRQNVRPMRPSENGENRQQAEVTQESKLVSRCILVYFSLLLLLVLLFFLARFFFLFFFTFDFLFLGDFSVFFFFVRFDCKLLLESRG